MDDFMLVCAPKKLVGKKTKKKIVKFSLIFYRKIKGKKIREQTCPTFPPFFQEKYGANCFSISPSKPKPKPKYPLRS